MNIDSFKMSSKGIWKRKNSETKKEELIKIKDIDDPEYLKKIYTVLQVRELNAKKKYENLKLIIDNLKKHVENKANKLGIKLSKLKSKEALQKEEVIE